MSWDETEVEQLSAGIGRQMLNGDAMTLAHRHRQAPRPLEENAVEDLAPDRQRVIAIPAPPPAGRIGAVEHSGLAETAREQIANVLSGRLRFVIGDEEREVMAGESVLIPGGVPHRVEALDESVLLDVFAPRREDWLRGDDAYLRG